VDTVADNIGPRRLTCTVRSGILVKEVFSTIPLRGIPSYAMLKTEKCLQARTSYIDLQTRKIDVRSWRPECQPLPSGHRGSRDSAWVTTLIIPISGPRRLLPTFCSELAALRYVLRVSLDIRGMHHSPFALDVPLQVLYCRDVPVGSGTLQVSRAIA
jgi:hypothetical protein